jgi:hypothetical protein
MLESFVRLRAALACAWAVLLLASGARADVSPELADAIAQVRRAHPTLIQVRGSDRYLAGVDDAALGRLIGRIADASGTRRARPRSGSC